MFSGITQTTLTITQLSSTKHLLVVQLQRPPKQRCVLGGSVLLNGICSTITNLTKTTFTVEFMPETIRCTTVSAWKIGDHINAEWPITLQTELSGNIISGHVDAVGQVQQLQRHQNDTQLTLRYPKAAWRYLVPKGSITINGVNLTITAVTKTTVSVSLIPYTLAHTTLNSLQSHDRVNLEYDYITKIIVHNLKKA